MKRIDLKKSKLFSALVCFIVSTVIFAAKIDTVKTFSASMQKEIPAIIIRPDNFSTTKTYPVIHVL
jgi:hypothetical protein